MKSKKIISVILPVFAIYIFFSGCSDDQNVVSTTSEITVSGTVINLVNQSVPNVKVEIEGQSVMTSSDGVFSVSNVSKPYNLVVNDDLHNSSKLFYGLSSARVKIPGVESIDDSLQCEIAYTIPPEIFTSGVTGKIIFTDGKYVNTYDNLSPGFLLRVWLQDYSPVTGNLIVITYKKDGSGNIVSYENFGMSAPIQVSNGGVYSYNFSLAELSLNPGEKTLSGTINVQPGFTGEYNFYSLTFSDKRTPGYAALLMFESIEGNSFNIVTPTGLPIQFTNLLYTNYYGGQINNSEVFKLPEGTSGISLDVKEQPELLTPEDNATDVSGSTLFSFTEGTGSGIYKVSLIDQTQNKNYVIYISSNSFHLNEFNDLFSNGIPNSGFKWSVEKTGFANSVNDYVTTYTDRPEYFRNNSTERSFTTAK